MPPIWTLVLLICCRWVHSAPDMAQSQHLNVPYGQPVVLPCDGSALVGEEDIEVSWEAMGSEVLTITGDEVIINERYKGRAFLSSEATGGDWSVMLNSVMLSDTDMYECIWRGRRTLSTVWLTVERPEVDSVLEVYTHNASVTLPCYLDLPRNLPPRDLHVWWEKDGDVLSERRINEIYPDSWYTVDSGFNFLDPQNTDKFPLTLTQQMVLMLPGEYNCWYRTKGSEEERPGIPGTVNVILKGTFDVDNLDNYTENSTDEWGSALFWPTPFELNSEETATSEIPILLDAVTPPMEVSVSTEVLLMEAYEETATTYPEGVSSVEASEETAADPDGDLPDGPEEVVDWSNFPWVRIGLIAGVLLVTAAALCILGLLHKL